MNASMSLQDQLLTTKHQLLATKFFLPTAPGPVILRPRLHALLDKALEHPFTLVSAPAGFGKTTLLSTWAQALLADTTGVCWLSLDEEDNDPQLCWIYVISALQTQDPVHFTSLLTQLQSPSPLPLKSLLTQLINLLAESDHRFVLILDDYHLITEEQVYATLASLVEHLPAQLHLILATRADPPLPLPLLRAKQRAWEIRTEQMRCTTEEVEAFFQRVVGLHFPNQTIQEVTARTEGWLVGLQLLALSLPEQVEPLTLLEQISGEHRYILDYLTEVVLHKQPPEVQRFLLCTSILERFNASLCDAVMEQTGSQAMLEYLERANLFVVSLDRKRQWYRYHALFAQTLSHQLQQSHADLMPILHARASRWYAEHHQMTQAALHAFQSRDWYWAADLLEQAHHSLVSFTWGANCYALVQFQQWVEQLPAEILASRPHFCLACVHLLSMITPYPLLFRWLDLAEMALGAWLKEPMLAQGNLSSQEQKDQIGQVLTIRAILQSYTGEGPATLALSEQALARILLAKNQPTAALQRLEPARQRATAGQRWGHVIEIRLLQALAHQKLHEEPQALTALTEALRLGEPEGYIRSFVEEGEAMEALLSRLRKRCAKQGPTPYLDTLLTAFQQESKARHSAEKGAKAQPLPEPLSERERQVLHLLTQGASNQEIAQQLVIAYDTVKRHVSHIFSKLGVTNRVQAVKQAHDLGLLDEAS
jgi:LuxR family maltose regulon positive regulatory protein